MYPPEFDRLLSEARALLAEQARLAHASLPPAAHARARWACALLLVRAALQQVKAGVRQMQRLAESGEEWDLEVPSIPPFPNTPDAELQKLCEHAAAVYQRYADVSDGRYKPAAELKADALAS